MKSKQHSMGGDRTRPTLTGRLGLGQLPGAVEPMLINSPFGGGFGSRVRGGPPVPGEHMRLEQMRQSLAQLIDRWRMAGHAARPALVLRIRVMQEQIGATRRRNLAVSEYPSALAWVDSWDPSRDDAR